MRLQQIKLTNFRCFDDLTFDLPGECGLYLLTGKNEQNPRLGANGTGKSTLFDAICFGLFGKTSKEHKSGKLLNRTGGKGYKVELIFDTGTLTRSWGPIKITWKGEEVDDKKVQELFNLTFDQFLYAIYQMQEANYFVDLSPTGKLTFLSNLFELDLWLKCAEICKTKIQEKNVLIAASKSTIAALKNEHAQRELTIASMDSAIVDWIEQRDNRIIGFENEIKEQEARVTNVVDLDELTAIELESKADEEIIKQSLRKASDSVQTAMRAKTEVEIEIKMTTTKLERLLGKESKECPECNQIVTPEHIEPIALRLDEQIHAAQAKLVEAGIELANKKSDQAEIEERYSQLRDLQADSRQLFAQIRAEAAVRNTTLATIKRLNDQLGIEIAKTCPLLKVKDNSIKENLSCRERSIEEGAALAEYELEVEKSTFWVKNFAIIRLTILQDIASELELHFNEAFARMGLIDYSVSIETERELKSSEGTKKEITMRIFHDETEIDYDTCSGGERQRIRLATSVGTSDMIKANKGIDWPLRLVDEASQGLSEEGIADMLELMADVGKNNVTLMAEHRVADSGMFDNMYYITKQENGNSTGAWK